MAINMFPNSLEPVFISHMLQFISNKDYLSLALTCRTYHYRLFQSTQAEYIFQRRTVEQLRNLLSTDQHVSIDQIEERVKYHFKRSHVSCYREYFARFMMSLLVYRYLATFVNFASKWNVSLSIPSSGMDIGEVINKVTEEMQKNYPNSRFRHPSLLLAPVLNHLRGYVNTPKNGALIFSGLVQNEEKAIRVFYCYEPYLSTEEYFLKLDSQFHIDSLERMILHNFEGRVSVDTNIY